jgi:hypothetical protein
MNMIYNLCGFFLMEEWEDITYGKISYDLHMTMEYIYNYI